MAQKLFLTIALRKEVQTLEHAQNITDFVRAQLAPYPDVTLTATVTQPIEPPEQPA